MRVRNTFEKLNNICKYKYRNTIGWGWNTETEIHCYKNIILDVLVHSSINTRNKKEAQFRLRDIVFKPASDRVLTATGTYK